MGHATGGRVLLATPLLCGSFAENPNIPLKIFSPFSATFAAENRASMPTPILTASCHLCSHHCGVNRSITLGQCRIPEGLYIAHIGTHHGEEPVLANAAGVCNIFFSHCNLQCRFCQNFQISDNTTPLLGAARSLEWATTHVVESLKAGCQSVGLVSPTPYIPWCRMLIDSLHQLGYHPTIIYNTSAYDTPEALESLAGYVDIYLPDYKYGSYDLAHMLSGVRNYPDTALEAIATMIGQVGKELVFNTEGRATRGVIVRHLVLPGGLENTRAALLNLRMEFGADIYMSLLSQYSPTERMANYRQLGRALTAEEYQQAVEFFYSLGFHLGWLQQLDSIGHYTPDFTQENPFQPG